MNSTTILSIAQKHGILMQPLAKKGRPSVYRQEQVDMRNLFLLALYEKGKAKKQPLTQEDLAEFVGVAPTTIQNALIKAREIRRKADMIATFKNEL